MSCTVIKSIGLSVIRLLYRTLFNKEASSKSIIFLLLFYIEYKYPALTNHFRVTHQQLTRTLQRHIGTNASSEYLCGLSDPMYRVSRPSSPTWKWNIKPLHHITNCERSLPSTRNDIFMRLRVYNNSIESQCFRVRLKSYSVTLIPNPGGQRVNIPTS